MKTKHVLMALGLLISAGLVLFGGGPERLDAPAQPVVRHMKPFPAEVHGNSVAEGSGPRQGKAVSADTATGILAIKPRSERLREQMAQEDQGEETAGLFGSQSWEPPPKPNNEPPPVPVAPPLPYTYLGKQFADSHWEVYLAAGDRALVATEAAVLDGTYRVDAIKPPVLVLTYLPLKQVQQLSSA
jgi:hypothetical protein